MNKDRVLAKKVLDGDTQAFEEIIETYYPGLYGYLIKMGIPEDRSRNLAREIFIRAFRSLYGYNDRWEFSTWFYRLAAGVTMRFKRRHPELCIPRPETADFLPAAENAEQDESLNDILDPVHDEARSIIILHYYNRLPLREIGRIFGLSVTSVRMRIKKTMELITGENQGTGSTNSGSAGPVMARIKKEVPCRRVPVGFIMGRIEDESAQKPPFWKLILSPAFLRRAWPVAVPSVLAVILICMLFVQDVSKPFWDAVMTIFEDTEKPVSLDFSSENTSVEISFTVPSGLLSDDDLVSLLNESADDSWQVLYAGENMIVIRNGNTVACCRGGRVYRLFDPEVFGIDKSSSDALFSISPTGEFLLAGFSPSAGASEGGGIYLFSTTDGGYYRISVTSPERIVYAWAPAGNFLALAERDDTSPVFLLNLQALTLEEMKTGYPVKSLYASGNGGVGVYTSDKVMTAFTGDSSWKTEATDRESFFINPDSGTVWYISDGAIMKHVIGNNKDTAIDVASAAGNGGLADTGITDWRLVGNHLVFRMKNGYSGIMNMRTAKVSLFNTSRELKSGQLPWCLVSPSGSRVMFDNDSSFLIVSETSVTAPYIPGYGTLSPRNTCWLDDENIAFVRMVDETDPKAGELSVYAINVLTGEITEIYRSVDREPVLNNDQPSAASYLPPSQNGPDAAVTIYETDRATGRKAESYVTRTCKTKNGPGDSYADIGEIGKNEIVVYNTRAVNGWYLAQKITGMISQYDTRNRFWIRAENIHTYDKSSLPLAVITADKVRLSKTTLVKGNLVRVISRSGEKSYVIAEAPDVSFGITGWIDSSSFTTELSGAYFNQAYLKSGSTVYSRPDPRSEPVSDFTAVAGAGNDVFVHLTGNSKNGLVEVRHPEGMSGWVREQDIHLPGSPAKGTPSETPQGPDDAGQIDLNGDGTMDKISFTTDGKRYTLSVNQSRAEGQGSGIQSQYRLVDVDSSDPYREIVIEEHGRDGEYMSTFYYYDGRSLVSMRKVQGLCGNTDAVRGDGIVRSRTRGSLFETWYYIKEYRLNSQHRLVETPSAFYEKIGYADSNLLRLKIDSLPFAVSPGSTEISFILSRDERVRFIGSDNQRWCLFRTPDGRNGWLEVKNVFYIGDTGLASWEVFDGLNMED